MSKCFWTLHQYLAQHNEDKTELMLAGTKYNLSTIPACCRSLTLGGAQVVGPDSVRILGVLLTPDLSPDKHVTAVSAKCFFPLRQLRRIRRSLDDDSAATLVQALRSSPAGSTTVAVSWSVRQRRRPTSCGPNRLQHTQVRSRAESLPAMRASLAGCRWPGSVQSVCVQVYKTQHGAWIPVDTANTCPAFLDVVTLTLGSSRRNVLSTCQYGYVRRKDVCLYAGPTSWNSLPDSLKNINLTLQTFKRHRKTVLFSTY